LLWFPSSFFSIHSRLGIFFSIGASVAQSIKNGRAEVDVQAKNSLHLAKPLTYMQKNQQ
jgi:hypothetical protein